MKEIRITESRMSDALSQIDAIADLNPKESSCLRLLTEEMFSMCTELLQVCVFDFKITHQDNQYALCLSTKTRVDEVAREQLLSVSSSGKNAANKGIKGVMGAILEIFSIEEDPALYNIDWARGMDMDSDDYSFMWILSQYTLSTPADKLRKDWDGIEKSIIANFSNDVTIAVRSGKLEMTVTKIF